METGRFSPSRRRSVIRSFVLASLAILVAAGLWLCLSLVTMKTARTSPFPYWRLSLDLAEKGAEKVAGLLPAEADSPGQTPLQRPDVFLFRGWELGQPMGTCYVTVYEPDALTRLIDSTGIVHDRFRTLAQRTIRVQMKRTLLFDSALFAREKLFLASGAEVDSYDSAQGNYAAANRKRNGHLRVACDGRTQPAAVLSRGCLVNGDLIVPAKANRDREVSIDEEARLVGNILEAAETPDFPLVMPPWRLPSLPAIALSGGDVLTVTNSGAYPSISVEDGSTLIVDSAADLFVTGQLLVSTQSRLIISENAEKVSVFLDGDLTVDGESAIVNLTGRPIAFSIWGLAPTSRISICSKAPFVGTIYAPNSNIHIGPGQNFFGAVCGKEVRISEGSRVHYDEALRLIPSPEPRFVRVSREEL